MLLSNVLNLAKLFARSKINFAATGCSELYDGILATQCFKANHLTTGFIFIITLVILYITNIKSTQQIDLFSKRNRHLQVTCEKYANPLQRENSIKTIHVGKHQMERFYEFNDYNFAICLIPKVASTSLSTLFLKIAEFKYGSYKNVHTEIHNATIGSLRDKNKLIIVRHPFERLLSAYLYFLEVNNFQKIISFVKIIVAKEGL